jgi:hypothetical protein
VEEYLEVEVQPRVAVVVAVLVEWDKEAAVVEAQAQAVHHQEARSDLLED